MPPAFHKFETMKGKQKMSPASSSLATLAEDTTYSNLEEGLCSSSTKPLPVGTSPNTSPASFRSSRGKNAALWDESPRSSEPLRDAHEQQKQKHQRGPKRPTTPPSTSLSLDGINSLTVKETVWRDAQLSPSWRKYQLNKQVYNILLVKDRGLPITPSARSPRHISERAKRIVLPPRPKPRTAKKVRKEAGDLEAGIRTALLDDMPKTPWQKIQSVGREISSGIAGSWNGFMEQELEVQAVVLFVVISPAITLYNNLAQAFAMRQYEEGHAPPAPPNQPDWKVVVNDSVMGYALSSPIPFLVLDFGVAFLLGLLYLYWEDIKEWRDRQAKLSYQAVAKWQGMRGAFKVDKSDAGLERMFRSVDTDGSGKISEEEMRAAIKKVYGEATEDETVTEMMMAADTDNDGVIDLNEFKIIMRAGP